ncbi:hypothetical protein ACQPXH_15655 [Nocardia sp. CA-135953]|uniref:hypothetical protein n=1 Tax=Nocardia sp. CA-135953 TaxID=3239978 RepID=UPI003D96572B
MYYSASEIYMAEECLVLNMDSDHIGFTDEELRLLRAMVDESLVRDLEIVPAPSVPALKYGFSPDAPRGAISVVEADHVLAQLGSQFGPRRILRTWREPVGDAPDRQHLDIHRGTTWRA